MPKEIGNISSSRLFRISTQNEKTFPHSILFDFDKELSKNEFKKYIQYEFLRSLCFINDTDWLSDGLDENNNSETVFHNTLHNPENSKFTDEDKFLLQKLYSDDFIDQFDDYMYANYPWRYASSFINKKEHEFKVWGIVIALGILCFVLLFSYFKRVKYRYSYLNYLFPINLILLFFLQLNLVYNYLTACNIIVTWQNNILFNLIFPLVVAPLISFVLWGLEKISFKGNQNFSYQLILKVIFTFLSFLVLIIFVLVLESERLGLFEFFFPYIFFSAGLAIGRGILLYLNHYSDSLVKEKEVELSRLKEAKAEAEVKMLQSQINPHFLYNALNSIASLAHTDADKTEKMALSLSDLFRHSINRKEKKTNTLQDEIHLVRAYLEIEQIRFGDRLKFSIDVDVDLQDIEIPMFILQPLVENAIKHGISKIEDQGEINLQIVKKNNGILISVQDNGPDFPEGLVSGHGLQTVYDLLRFSYRDKAEISWHNQPKKEITIYIDTISE
jgi:sensor histidine kinase YesM